MAGPSNSKDATWDVQLEKLGRDLDHLHLLYEQHFAGVHKREPLSEHDRFKKIYSTFGPATLKTTASKFRFQTLTARYVQYQTLWAKILKQMEEGTYKRDLFLLEKKKERERDTKTQTKVGSSAIDRSENTSAGKSADKGFEMLYEKYAEQAAKLNHPTPDRAKFIGAVKDQYKNAQQKYPGQKLEFKIKKDHAGKIAVSLGVKPAHDTKKV